MSIQGGGTYDTANLEGDDINSFEDLIVYDKLYLNANDYGLGYTDPLIESVYDSTIGTDVINISTPNSAGGVRIGYGTGVNTFEPYLTIDGDGLQCDTDKSVSYYNLGCLQGASSNIQSQIDGIVAGAGYWGGFWSTSTQTNPTANTINLVTYTNSDPSNNQVSYSNNSRLNVTNKATYLVNASFQLSKSQGSTEEAIYFFLRKNGTDVSASGYKEYVKAVPKILTASWIIDLSGNDYVEIAWWSSDIHAQLEFIAGGTGTPVYPSSPSALVSLNAVSKIAGSSGTTNPVLGYFTLTDTNPSRIVCTADIFRFGSNTSPISNECRGNLDFTKLGAQIFISNGRIRSNGFDYTNELRNLKCDGTVTLYNTTATLLNTTGLANLSGQVSLGTYNDANKNITCNGNFLKRTNDQFAVYVKTGDLKLEAGTMYPNNIYFDASNNWNGVELKTNNMTSIGTITANDIIASGSTTLNGNTTICDNLNDTIILNGKLGYGTAPNSIPATSIDALGAIRSDFDIIAKQRLIAGTSPQQVVIDYNNSSFFNLNATGQVYFYGNFFVIDNANCYINLKGNVVLGSSSNNTVATNANFVNRGDGYSIYASSGDIRANGGNLTTPNDIYCNCYSVGAKNYGYFKLWDFIREQDEYNYDRTTGAINTANNANDKADGAIAAATAAGVAAGVAGGVATTALSGVSALNTVTVPTIYAAINTTNGRVSAVENKTQNMLPANAGYASHFLEHVQIYQSSDPYNPVIDLNPNGLTTIGGGVKTNQIRHTSDNTKLDITYGVNTGDITCDEIGSNSITNSGNLTTGSINTGSITATTGTHSIDGTSVSIGSYLTPVYINGLLYIPFNPLGFFSQW
jgi:hypothetical protein